MRLDGKTAVVVGAGQTEGETVGNGRATALLFAREGAQVLAVDRDAASAEQTRDMIRAEGGTCEAFVADVENPDDCRGIVDSCMSTFGALDVLENNVGIVAGDSFITELDVEGFDRIFRINLRGMALTIKHALPVMRDQGGGSIINISSIAPVIAAQSVAYSTSKAGVNNLTRVVASGNARYSIRANCIMPGLMETPLGVEGGLSDFVNKTRSEPLSREEYIAKRNARVPLGGKMGSGWDVAFASLFFASDESKFITGAVLAVDGGGSLKTG